MKHILIILSLTISATIPADAEDFNAKIFAKQYFEAWRSSQTSAATTDDLEQYLALLTDDIGHQHLPYDTDDVRSADGKERMRLGMRRYLGLHTEYHATLNSIMLGHQVIIIDYTTRAKGVHPQTKEEILLNYDTVEVLEIEKGKVSVIRKYSE